MKERVKFVLEWEERWSESEGRLKFATEPEQWHVVVGPLSLGGIAESPLLHFKPTKGRMADQVENAVFARLSGMSSD